MKDMSLKEVLFNVSKRITPTLEERTHIISLAEKLKKRVKKVTEEMEIGAEVRIEGSVAKETWLREEPDIDLFMRIPTTFSKEALGTICLEAAKHATKEYKQIERFAEHPYLECEINGVLVNIVPCFKVKYGNWISSMDRTPFHTDYFKPLLNDDLRKEIRFLKRFMKGIGTYGAEIKIAGFSGYLCELLILQYRTFQETLKSASDWSKRKLIDYEGHYKGREGEALKYFKEPIIVIDPVDKKRNVAAAVKEKRLNEFIAASRLFLKNPGINFFYPKKIEAFKEKKIKTELKKHSLIFIIIRTKFKVPDVLWGQLYKIKKSLSKDLFRSNFKILREDIWSNEKGSNIIIFEVENLYLPSIKKHFGPPISKKEDSERFLEKHLKAKHTISGPRIEEYRWTVEINRKEQDIVEFLKNRLEFLNKTALKNLTQNTSNPFEVLVNKEILNLYFSNEVFAEFLTEYLRGRPLWLNP
jgi:tRNA nucleotidyltransferase (CCA-adding enzyme)